MPLTCIAYQSIGLSALNKNRSTPAYSLSINSSTFGNVFHLTKSGGTLGQKWPYLISIIIITFEVISLIWYITNHMFILCLSAVVHCYQQQGDKITCLNFGEGGICVKNCSTQSEALNCVIFIQSENCLRLHFYPPDVASAARKLPNQPNNQCSFVVWLLFTGLCQVQKGLKSRESIKQTSKSPRT